MNYVWMQDCKSLYFLSWIASQVSARTHSLMRKPRYKFLLHFRNLLIIVWKVGQWLQIIFWHNTNCRGEDLSPVVYLTLYFAMSQNGQTHFKNIAAFAEKFLKYLWPFTPLRSKALKELLYNVPGNKTGSLNITFFVVSGSNLMITFTVFLELRLHILYNLDRRRD